MPTIIAPRAPRAERLAVVGEAADRHAAEADAVVAARASSGWYCGARGRSLLYISGSDHGFSNGGGPNSSNPAQTQRLDSVITAVLRIDPRCAKVRTHSLRRTRV
jgi:hypothetical protein